MPGDTGPDHRGTFLGRVVAELLDDGRLLKLLEDFGYVDPDGDSWHALKGRVVDGASIPRALWSIVGSPLVGKYRRASVLHDVACDEKTARWPDVHRMFYHAMRCDGVSDRRALYMYAAVYHFGPRWRVPGELFQIEAIPGVDDGDEFLDALSEPTEAELESLHAMIEVDGTVTTLGGAEDIQLR